MRQFGAGSMPFYKSRYYQGGEGIGSFFRRIYKWMIPIAKKHVLPIAQDVGNNLVNNVANLARDAIQGKNLKDSAQKRLGESLNDLSETASKIKKKIVPGVESLGSEVLSGVTNFATDTINGVDPKESANVRFNQTLDSLSKKAGVLNVGRIKSIVKRKLKSIKRKKDIFDF